MTNSDDLMADSFRLGTDPTNEDVSRANWIIDRQSARIEELEADLAKAVGALEDIYDGEPEWPDDPKRELDWCRNRARTTHKELKG